MSDDAIRYRGRLIEALTIEELRAALTDCIRYAQATTQMHTAHITMLQNLMQRDDDQQQRLFMEYAK